MALKCEPREGPRIISQWSVKTVIDSRDDYSSWLNDRLFEFGSELSASQGRRAFLLALAANSASILAMNQSRAETTEPNNRRGLLIRPVGVDSLAIRSRLILELDGKLRIAEPDKTKKSPERTAEVKAKSTLDYEDFVAFNESTSLPAAAARKYTEASVETWVAGHATSQSLRSECYQVKVARHNGIWQQYCESEPLTTREVELLQSPINSLIIDQLLPEEPVQPLTKWKISEQVATELFGLDAVHVCSLEAQITQIENGVATIEFSGDLEASTQSVATRLSISGNLQAELASKSAIVTWAGLVIKEKREISETEPGFEITARVRLIRKESDAPATTDIQQLLKIAQSDDPARWYLQLQSINGRYRMLADRRWKTIIDSGDEAILRLIQNNKVIAQCNVTRLPKLEPGRQLTVAGLQADIQRSLDKHFGSFVESSERVTPNGLRLVRAVVAGSSSDVPVQWVYAHLSNDSGRRVALVFTMSGEDAEAFAVADDQMLSSFELLPESPSPQQPTPVAEPPERAATVPSVKKSR